MKILNRKKLIASMVIAALSSTAGSVLANDTFDVIVKLKDGNQPFVVSNKEADSKGLTLSQRHAELGQQRKLNVEGFTTKNKISTKHVYNNVYYGFSASVTQAQLDELKRDPNVAGVYEDKILHIVGSKGHGNFSPAHQTYKKRRTIVDWPQIVPQAPAESGAADSSYRGAGQHVYVIDTGIDTSQNDLADNLGDSYAAESCGWPDDVRLCPESYSDDHGHGTHVAGTVAAADNAINALGIAPQATVHAAKVCTKEGSCPTSSILDGLNWAVSDMLGRGQPAVANLSLAGPADGDAGECSDTGYIGDDVVAESYCNAAHQGMVIVVAAGNSSDDAALYTPAGFDSTITVSSYTSYDDLTGEAVFTNFSNYGQGPNDWSTRESGAITIAAPGDTILSLNRTHAVRNMSGTSMASPAVAGAAALVLEKHPQAMDFTAMQNVRQLLVDNATFPAVYSTEPDGDIELNFPHEEGLLNVRFLDE